MTKEEVIDQLIEAKKGYKIYLTNEVIDIVIKVLKQEPCEYAISRQVAKKALEDRFMELQKRHSMDRYETNFCLNTILELPPISPQLKIGRWIKHDTGHSIYYECSLCHCIAPCTETADSVIWKFSNYCPDCGAKMEHD